MIIDKSILSKLSYTALYAEYKILIVVNPINIYHIR